MRMIDDECKTVREALEPIYREDVSVREVDRFMDFVKNAMVNYAIAAQIDSTIRQEIDDILKESPISF
jgi:hypothetical protein